MFAGGSTYSGLSGGNASSGGAGGSGNSGGSNANASGHASSSSGGANFTNALAEANDLDALVFEFGTSRSKFGFAGEDFPRVYESPLANESEEEFKKDERAFARRAAQMETDYEAVAQWLFDAASSRLQTRLSDHPLLLVERPFAIPDEMTHGAASAGENKAKHDDKASETTGSGSKKRDFKARERMVEVLMESVDLPALFCAKSSVLTCYANARTSGLVVEMGATYTSITSVHEGYAFAYPKSQVLLYGGYDLDAFLRYKLDAQIQAFAAAPSSPTAKKPRLSGGPRYYWSLATEAKESGLCRVADGPFDEAQNAQLPKISYELPDKTIVQLGTERFSVGEQYFVPPSADSNGDPSETVSELENEALAKFGVKRGLSLPELVCETGALTAEAELRKELFQNVVLTGGSSCFENMPTRLEREIVVSLSSQGAGGAASTGFTMTPGFGSTRVKLVAAHAQERRIGSFLGGSILASLGSFHEMWMSKAEYAEHGAALIHKKCP